MEINQVRTGRKPRSAVHELLIEKLVAYGNQAVNITTILGHEIWVWEAAVFEWSGPGSAKAAIPPRFRIRANSARI